MSDCQKLEPLVTAYVDGEAPVPDRTQVEAHLCACGACRSRVEHERAVRALFQDRRHALVAEAAPLPLRARCQALAGWRSAASRPLPRNWRARAMPLALAASLTLIVGGAFVYQATSRSSQVLAAELAADHVKCFAANRVLGRHSAQPGPVEHYLASSFGWETTLPTVAGLNLEAARPCLYGEGRIAHVMYRYGGRPISLFMLPGTTRRDEVVQVMGHEAAIWSDNGRTFVLVAREPREEVQRLAATMRGLK